LSIENIKEKYKHLFDFKLKKEIDDKYFVLEFVGTIKLEEQDIVQFLLDLMSYSSKKFKPQFMTIGIRKEMRVER
jgi:hypothetical protein